MRDKLVTISMLLTLLAFACSGKRGADGISSDDVKFRQYFIQGEQLYARNCSNCHQKDGTGLALLYPPLNPSDYADQHLEDVICLMKHGISGPLMVNGKQFNKEMKGVVLLTDLEIAEITTFIYNSWGRNKGIIDVTQTSAVLGKCQPR